MCLIRALLPWDGIPANRPSIDTFQMLRMVQKRLVLLADSKGLVCGDGNEAHLAHMVFQ